MQVGRIFGLSSICNLAWPEPGNMNIAYLLIGGNMGNRLQYLQQAKEAIQRRCGTITTTSAIYESEAWGMENQKNFLNQALEVHTSLGAVDFLQCLLQIETALGRQREKKYGPRTIDIDILFFNDEHISSSLLQVPHPQVQHRRFALQCLHDINPGLRHPLLNKTINELLQECTDKLKVWKY